VACLGFAAAAEEARARVQDNVIVGGSDNMTMGGYVPPGATALMSSVVRGNPAGMWLSAGRGLSEIEGH